MNNLLRVLTFTYMTLLLSGINSICSGQTLDIGSGEFDDRLGQTLAYDDPYRAINIHDGGRLRVDVLDWLNNGQLTSGQPGTITVTGTNSLLETRLNQGNGEIPLFLSLGTTRIASGGRISTWQSFVYGSQVDVEDGIFDSGTVLTLAPNSTARPSELTSSNSVVAAGHGRLSGDVSVAEGSRLWLASANIGVDFGRGEVVVSQNSTLGIGTSAGDSGTLRIGTSLKDDSTFYDFSDTASKLVVDSSHVTSTRAEIGLTERQSERDNSLSSFGMAQVELIDSTWNNSAAISVENGLVVSTSSVIECGSINIDSSQHFSGRFEVMGGSLSTSSNADGIGGGLSLYGGNFKADGGAIVQFESDLTVGEQNFSGATSASPRELSEVVVSAGSQVIADQVILNSGLGDSTLVVDGVGSSLSATNIFFDAGNFASQQVGAIDVKISNGASVAGDFILVEGEALVEILDDSTMRASDFLFIQDDAKLMVGSESYLRAGSLGISQSPSSSESLLQLEGRLDVDRVYNDFLQDGGILVFDENNGITVFDQDYWLSEEAQIEFNIEGLLRGEDYGSVSVLGVSRLDGILDVNLLDGVNPGIGDSFQLFDGQQIVGNYSFDFTNAQLAQGLRFDTSNFRDTGFISVVAVPEPNSLLLSLIGTCGLLCLRRRSKLI